jgi:branched-chain amino acid transport system permease protein
MTTFERLDTYSIHSLRAQAPFALLAVAAIGVGMVAPKVIGSPLLLTLMVPAIINAVLATSVGMLFKFNGVISFGHAAFYGLGMYTLGLVINDLGIAAELAIVLSLVIPTLLAFVLGLRIVSISGAAFAMLTLAIGQAFYEIALKARGLTNGDDGVTFNMPDTIFGIDSSAYRQPETMFIICWVVLVLTILGLTLLSHSRFGRVAIAIRENEERARFIGYTTRIHRALVFALSALIAAVAGVLAGLYAAYTSPESLTADVSGSALIMAITGGPKLIWGPALGAVIFFLFKDIVGDYTEHWQAILGIAVIVVIVLIPQGIGGLLNDLARNLIARRGS